MSKRSIFIRVVVFVLIVLFAVSACGKADGRPDSTLRGDREVRPLRLRYTEAYAVLDDGVFFMKDDQLLSFYDQTEDITVVVCGRAACKHDESDDCDALLTGLQTMFVVDDKLYVVERVFDPRAEEAVIRITSSAWDRSERTELLQVPGPGLASLLLDDTTLYGVFTYVEIDKAEAIGQADMPTGRASHVLFSLSLKDGAYDELLTFEWEHSSSMQLSGLSGTNLYFARQKSTEKTYKNGFLDYSPEAQPLYEGEFGVVDLASQELAPVYLETDSVPWISLSFIRDNAIYFYDRLDPADFVSASDLKRLDLETNNIDTVLTPQAEICQWGDDFFYVDRHDGLAYHFNVTSGEKEVIEATRIAAYSFIEFEAPATILAMKKSDGDQPWESVRLDRKSFLDGAFDEKTGRYDLEQSLRD